MWLPRDCNVHYNLGGRFLKLAGADVVSHRFYIHPALEVAYPWAADKYFRPLASRLSSVKQPVMLTRNAFSTPRPTQLACI